MVKHLSTAPYSSGLHMSCLVSKGIGLGAPLQGKSKVVGALQQAVALSFKL